jgi:hypothetical protein
MVRGDGQHLLSKDGKRRGVPAMITISQHSPFKRIALPWQQVAKTARVEDGKRQGIPVLEKIRDPKMKDEGTE